MISLWRIGCDASLFDNAVRKNAIEQVKKKHSNFNRHGLFKGRSHFPRPDLLGGGYYRRAGNSMLASASGVAAWDQSFRVPAGAIATHKKRKSAGRVGLLGGKILQPQ